MADTHNNKNTTHNNKNTTMRETIRRLRLEQGKTLSETASYIGVKIPSVYNWEAGTAKPSPKNLRKLAEFLHVSTGALSAQNLPADPDEFWPALLSAAFRSGAQARDAERSFKVFQALLKEIRTSALVPTSVSGAKSNQLRARIEKVLRRHSRKPKREPAVLPGAQSLSAGPPRGPNNMGERLREARLKAGYQSVVAACKTLGWKYQTYDNHENGRQDISRTAALRYAKAFQTDPAYLIYGDDARVEGVDIDATAPSEVSKRLRAARRRAGYRSGAAAAEALGWKYSTYASHENGGRSLSHQAAQQYGLAFNVAPGHLLYGKSFRKASIEGIDFDLALLNRLAVATLVELGHSKNRSSGLVGAWLQAARARQDEPDDRQLRILARRLVRLYS